MSSEHIKKIYKLLNKEYPDAKTALHFRNPLEILVATILSAQCTDAQVNRVTHLLFRKYREVKDYANADIKTFEQEIRSTGFYRNKAKNIISAAGKMLESFNGRVPDSMNGLLELPGVGRKTANIVLLNGFGKIEGIAVDTHVRRLSLRLGLSKHNNPDKIEQDLMRQLPKKEWGRTNYLLIEHGRKVCKSQRPKCLDCVIGQICSTKKIRDK